MNWYGRDDFEFHVYRKTDTVDPDTGYNFGTERDSRAMIAWGGSSGRTWFYDLSAGPESWSGNWNVDDADVDGDGAADYRMPPVWEYAANGNRKRSVLGSDLGKVVRYVALNLLFTSSPLYDPMNTAPEPGGAKKIAYTMFEGDPGSQGTDFLDLASSKSEWQDLEPYITWKTTLNDVDPIDAGARSGRSTLRRPQRPQGLLGPVRRHVRAAVLLLRRASRPVPAGERQGLRRRRLRLQPDQLGRPGLPGRAARLRRRQLGRRDAVLRLRVRRS